MEKVKIGFLVPKALSEAMDKLIALITLRGGKLKKTDLATEALMREYFKRQLEIEKDKLKVLRDVDLECLADKMIKLKNSASKLSEDKFKEITSSIAEKGFRHLDKNIEKNGREVDRELQYIASLFDVAGLDKNWDRESVKYLVLLALEDCQKIKKCKEEARKFEEALEELL